MMQALGTRMLAALGAREGGARTAGVTPLALDRRQPPKAYI